MEDYNKYILAGPFEIKKEEFRTTFKIGNLRINVAKDFNKLQKIYV